MSQVQVRQVPLATSTDAQRVIGSWFPSGYYGHFRAKSRADLCNYFRQLARPAPPKKFLDRQRAEATTHMFSQHDNRFKFESDPLVRGTQSGFGKRKSETNIRGEFDPLFVSWVPKNVDRKNFVDAIKITSYAEDYNRDPTAPHLIAEIQATEKVPSSGEKESIASTPMEDSLYSQTYKHGQPNSEQSKEIRRETFQRYCTARTRLTQQKATDRSPSVAACLVWNDSSNTNNTNHRKTSSADEQIINIVVPITLQPRVNTNTTNVTPRQRAQSAGPRLISTGSKQLPFPPPPPQPTYQSQSMQMFRSTIGTNERPHTATTTSREHYKGANFGLKVAPPPRATTSFEHSQTNSMESLISKYM